MDIDLAFGEEELDSSYGGGMGDGVVATFLVVGHVVEGR